jgi:hypothetical protein
MKLINKKNFLPTVCVVYTVISLSKIIMESIFLNTQDNSYVNFIWILGISVISTYILSLHYYLQRFPLVPVIAGQYLIVLAIVTLGVFIEGQFVPLHVNAYRDMFWSVTIPYIIGALIYYVQFWLEIKKANKLIKDLKKYQESQ